MEWFWSLDSSESGFLKDEQRLSKVIKTSQAVQIFKKNKQQKFKKFKKQQQIQVFKL